MGLGRAIGWGEILKSSHEGKSQRDGTIFMGGVDPSRHHVKVLIWQLEGARLDEMVKKWGRERFYISCNYFCTIPFSVKISLVQLKYLYIQYA